MKEKGNIFFCGGEDELRRKRRKTFRGGKYIYCGGIEEGRRKWRKILGEGNLAMVGQRTNNKQGKVGLLSQRTIEV